MRALALLALFAAPLIAADNDYVDPRLCATCHADIAKTYRQTGMGRSFYRPTGANTVEDYTKNNQFYHALSDTHYAMIRRDGAFYQRRWQIGFDGKEENVEETKIDYIIGSGNHSRTYLHRTVRGTLIELPLSWYSEKGGIWGMSPAFDSRHPLTRRLTSYECIGCHNAYPRIPAGNDSAGSEPVFTGDLPEGIDCQRCHGPGGRHVRTVQTAGATPAQIRASIVNPARLSPKLRMDVCLQCHLEPTSAAFPALVRRFNRGPFSFHPGEPLEDFVLTFDHAPGTGHEDKFEIVGSAAYRLRKSQCFLQSKGALTCDTCHNPHSIPRGEEAVQHYASVCRQCHGTALDTKIAQGAHPAGADCVGCHMPKRRTEDVVHVIMTDHLISRRPPPGDLLADLAEKHPPETEDYRGEVVPYYPAVLPNAMYGALAQVLMANNLQKGMAEFSREITMHPPREADWYLAFGDGWQALGKPAQASAAYERALQMRPDSLRGLLSLAGVAKAAGRPQRAQEALARATEIAPRDGRAWFQEGMLEAEQGHTEDALSKMRKAIALDPDLPGAYTSMASVLMLAGQSAPADAALGDALRIDPYDAMAWDLAGRSAAGNRRMPEALFDFERAIRYRPNFAPHLYDYALALASTGRSADARQSAEAALKADPKMAEAHVLLGGLFAGQRQLPEATREYREAVRLRPDFARAHLDLAAALANQGDMPGAIEQLRIAAKGNDPQTAQLAAQALQRLGQH